MSKRILVVSSATMEITLPVATLPTAGQILSQDGGISYRPGGRGANSAVTLAALGAETFFCARLGRDSHGETLYDYYRERGIDVKHLVLDRTHPTGCTVMLEAKRTEGAAIEYPGANRFLTDDDVDGGFLCCPDALYLQLDIGTDAALYAADYAHRHDIPVFVDGGPDPDFPLEKLPPMTVFSPSEEEATVYTGIRVAGSDSMLAACMELFRRVTAEYIVLKLGDRGAYICNGRHCKFVSPFPVKAVDTAGAGDAFTAAMTLRYLENGGDINDAVWYGCAAGALTVSRRGAAYAVPQSRAELEAFLAAQEAERL